MERGGAFVTVSSSKWELEINLYFLRHILKQSLEILNCKYPNGSVRLRLCEVCPLGTHQGEIYEIIWGQGVPYQAFNWLHFERMFYANEEESKFQSAVFICKQGNMEF